MNTRVQLYIGTSGWSYDHWVERFYPRELKKNEWFPYFAEHFASVELNMSFYRYPSVKMLEGWKTKMPAGFRMTFKANRRITPYKKFQGVEREVGRFYDLFEVLGEKAGCILFQTPASFPCNGRNFAALQSFMGPRKRTSRSTPIAGSRTGLQSYREKWKPAASGRCTATSTTTAVPMRSTTPSP